MPNTEVKPRSGYYTAFICGKIARCRIIEKAALKGAVFLFQDKGNPFLDARVAAGQTTPAALFPKRNRLFTK